MLSFVFVLMSIVFVSVLTSLCFFSLLSAAVVAVGRMSVLGDKTAAAGSA